MQPNTQKILAALALTALTTGCASDREGQKDSTDDRDPAVVESSRLEASSDGSGAQSSTDQSDQKSSDRKSEPSTSGGSRAEATSSNSSESSSGSTVDFEASESAAREDNTAGADDGSGEATASSDADTKPSKTAEKPAPTEQKEPELGEAPIAEADSGAIADAFQGGEKSAGAAGPTLGARSSRSSKGRRTRRRSRRVKKKAAVRAKPAPERRHRPPSDEAAPSKDDGKKHRVNPMTDTKKDARSTFSIDVDTGSYTLARSKLRSGSLPSVNAVRVEEFVNYFDYGYAGPDDGPFAVHFEAAPSPFSAEKDRYLMRVGVQGKKIAAGDRKPVHLTFLVDVSGSMRRPNKLGLAKKSLELLTNNLRQGDTVAIATYAGRVAKILEPTGVEHREKIVSSLRGLRSGGSTAMNDGLGLAYKLALKNYKADHVNRVIVLSDGDANVGPSSHRGILKQIKKYVDEGVTLSTIGFGRGNYRDALMEQLANKGNGNYYYIDNMDEARKVFGDQLDGTLEVIAKDVKIQVEFDPEVVTSYRLVGYENRDIADHDFRNDRVDAGEIGAGHSVTAIYEVVMAADRKEKDLATVRLRHKKPQGHKAVESTFSFTASDVHARLSEASKSFQFAAAVTAFAEVLRNSPYAKELGLALVEEIAKSAVDGKKAREEFVALVGKAKKLRGGK